MNTSSLPDGHGPQQVSCHDVHYLRCTDGGARWGATESGLTFCFMYGGDHCCGRCKFGDFRSEATYLGPTISRMYIL
jgi:6-phosphogluconate dehydrogenase (decarboxylating)